MHVLWPQPDDCRNAVVLVPPGFSGGVRYLDGQQAQDLARAGRFVVGWDPRGRGGSEGDEDANGFLGQDDLAALLRWVAWQDDVDPTSVVLFSRSFGGALAAGALARHDELAPLAWLDVESPGWTSQDLAIATDHNRVVFEEYLGDNDPEAFWAEREPAGLMGAVTVPYRRAQGLPDHALGQYVDHARAMIDHATASPEIRYNGLVVEPPSARIAPGTSPSTAASPPTAPRSPRQFSTSGEGPRGPTGRWGWAPSRRRRPPRRHHRRRGRR